MGAHSRYASARRNEAPVSGTYRVPDDVLVCILVKLDPVSLLRFCKVSRLLLPFVFDLADILSGF